MPSKSRQLLPALASGGALLGLALLTGCASGIRGDAVEADGLTGANAETSSPRRARHARGLAMPYFSFAQSLRPRN